MRHAILPAAAPLALVGLYFTPTSVIACSTRGLLALGIVLASAIGAFVAIGRAFAVHRRDDPEAGWWIVSAAMLTSPLALLLGPLG